VSELPDPARFEAALSRAGAATLAALAAIE
jgi:hypothetical protein